MIKFDDLIAHFGSQAKAAKALNLDRQVVWAWKHRGIPLTRQYQIQVVTDGALKPST
jgi:hypothetical protein